MTGSGAIIRVSCVDGPHQGLQYLDADTGRILFQDLHDGRSHIYRLNHDRAAPTVSVYPHAYFDHSEPAEPHD